MTLGYAEFTTSLTGAALEWFKNRPHKSIPDYVTLCTMFLAQYCRNKKQKKSIASLFTITQVTGGEYDRQRSEDDQESEEVYRSRLRVAHKLRRISSVSAIASGSISIGFGDGDLSRVQLPHEDPLVINLLVANCMIRRVLIDPGSSANIVTKTIFEQLEIPSSSIRPTSSPLMGFNGTRVDRLGVIDLSVTAAKKTQKENFVLTEIHRSYNLIMGRS
ncbi:uncharacterized protein LOC132281238 [Cornus florida]|uniref:uncharacterized protein LOC132281238 n=1 Tax=Cornus florida TaxID=4283 RepID=UPI00289B8BE4|nr:uncharacterized protein LOC132281238 [Cornus florida]